MIKLNRCKSGWCVIWFIPVIKALVADMNKSISEADKFIKAMSK